MKFGTNTFLTDYSIQPVALARALEERGFESMFVTEHTHIPTSRRTPSYVPGELPQEYWHTHDAFTALGAAAAVTSTIKIGTGVCLVVVQGFAVRGARRARLRSAVELALAFDTWRTLADGGASPERACDLMTRMVCGAAFANCC